MRLPILAVGSLMLCCASASAADPRGVWLVEDQSGQIEIGNCAGALWGILVWERAPGRDRWRRIGRDVVEFECSCRLAGGPVLQRGYRRYRYCRRLQRLPRQRAEMV